MGTRVPPTQENLNSITQLEDLIKKRSLDSLDQQKSGISDTQSQLEAYKGMPSQLDISPLAALVDQWTGSNLSQAYNRPVSNEERLKTISGLQNAVQKARGGLSESELELLKNTLGDKKATVAAEELAKQHAIENHFRQQEIDLKGKALGAKPAKNAGLDAVNKKFAEEYTTSIGGYSKTKKSLDQVDSSIKALQENPELTGTMMIKAVPEAMLAKAGFNAAAEAQSNAYSSISNSLREIYGPQFTAKEGQRILSTAWNKDLPPEVNIRNLNRIKKQMSDDLEAKMSAAKYYKEHNFSLEGYEGPANGESMSGDSLLNVIKDTATPPAPKVGDVVKGHKFKGGDPSLEANWESQ